MLYITQETSIKLNRKARARNSLIFHRKYISLITTKTTNALKTVLLFEFTDQDTSEHNQYIKVTVLPTVLHGVHYDNITISKYYNLSFLQSQDRN